MKKFFPLLATLALALLVASKLAPPRDKADALPVANFGKLPVVANGRVQPLDSLARNTLLQLLEKQSVRTAPWERKSQVLSASAWLLEMFFAPDQADTRPVFRIDHPDLKGMLGLPLEADPQKHTDGKSFAWVQIREKLETLQNEAHRAGNVEESHRNAFDRAVLKLWTGVGLYMRLQNTVQPQNARQWEKDLLELAKIAPAGREAALAQQAGKPFDSALLDRFVQELQRADTMNRLEPALVIAPSSPSGTGASAQTWSRAGDAIMSVARGQPLPSSLRAYAAMGTAFRNNDPAAFRSVLTNYEEELAPSFAKELRKTAREQQFNAFAPFYQALALYLVVGLCVLAFMIAPERLSLLRDTAHGITVLALLVHSAGLIFRMVLEGRPPVTNLYSSAVFIGWGACILGLLLERFWRNGIGLSVSSATGFLTLIIAHHLSISGDTMEMMRAVLDTNFWLATHVVVVTLGYSATFVAGFLAMLYVIRGTFTRSLTPDIAKSLSKMVYGIVCFAALFSFVGTVLGGIWADQSWGRFWGWDAKENGALMIVLWNAVFLHARWGGLLKERGLMALALGGNIVTAWSWFGVNMLGIGLHSYGFMSAAFAWLMLFVGSQLLLIALTLLPHRLWRSQPA